MPYANKLAARTRAIALSKVSSPDTVYVDELLDIYAATLPDAVTIEYRPFIVAAKLAEQNQRSITEADGVKFKDQTGFIDGLLSTQSDLDASGELVIKPGLEAVPSDCDRCAAVASPRRYPTTVQTRLA